MDLTFDRRGAGEPLVLLHGIGSHWQVWRPVLGRLAESFEVWALDLPGFGSSPPFPREKTATVEALTQATADFIEAHGLDRPHVAGNSTGGGIALELADRGLARSATALSPIGFWSTRERRWAQASVRNARNLSTALRPAVPALMGNAITRSALFGQFVARPWRLDPAEAVADVEALIGAASFDATCASFAGYLAPATAADRVPVTIAWGSRDFLLLSRQLNRARTRLPNARHLALDGCGHVPMPDDPERVAEVLIAGAAT